MQGGTFQRGVGGQAAIDGWDGVGLGGVGGWRPVAAAGRLSDADEHFSLDAGAVLHQTQTRPQKNKCVAMSDVALALFHSRL